MGRRIIDAPGAPALVPGSCRDGRGRIGLAEYARPELGAQMQPLGDAFVNLVRMIIAPVIFCTVVHGVASMNDMKRVGRVALKALIWFEAITLIALVFALVAVNLWQPGAGMNVDPAALDASSVRTYALAAQNQTIAEYLVHIIPNTLFSAFVQGDVLQVLFVSVLFAFAVALVGESARPVLDISGRLSQIFFRIVGLIMWVAPLGAFGAIAFTVGRFGASSLLSLGALILEFYIVCLLFVLVVLGGVARLIGVSIFRLLYYIREELLIVAATTSSETVLPRLVQKLQALGCEEIRCRPGDSDGLFLQSGRHLPLPRDGCSISRAGDQHSAEFRAATRARRGGAPHFEGCCRRRGRGLRGLGGHACIGRHGSGCQHRARARNPSPDGGGPDLRQRGGQLHRRDRRRQMGTLRSIAKNSVRKNWNGTRPCAIARSRGRRNGLERRELLSTSSQSALYPVPSKPVEAASFHGRQPGAVDAHCHVFGPAAPFSPTHRSANTRR